MILRLWFFLLTWTRSKTPPPSRVFGLGGGGGGCGGVSLGIFARDHIACDICYIFLHFLTRFKGGQISGCHAVILNAYYKLLERRDDHRKSFHLER